MSGAFSRGLRVSLGSSGMQLGRQSERDGALLEREQDDTSPPPAERSLSVRWTIKAALHVERDGMRWTAKREKRRRDAYTASGRPFHADLLKAPVDRDCTDPFLCPPAVNQALTATEYDCAASCATSTRSKTSRTATRPSCSTTWANRCVTRRPLPRLVMRRVAN